MDIYSLNQEGWSLIDRSTSQILYAKTGTRYNESYIARVVFFPLEFTENKQEFLNLIKIRESKNNLNNRFTTMESNIKLSEQRNYPCVMAEQLFKDKTAITSCGNKEKLFMQIKSLYFKDKRKEDSGVMIGYSYRGAFIDPNFDLEADNFIKGVQFSSKDWVRI